MTKYFIILCLSLFLSMPFASAHLANGADKIVGQYLVDFGYDPTEPTSDNKVTMAFNIVDKDTAKVIEPGSVWIRISNQKKIVFSGTFHPAAGNVTFSYIFPYADNYQVDAQFYGVNNQDVLAKTSFDLPIKPSSLSPTKNQRISWIEYSIWGILVIGMASVLIYKKR